MPLTLLADVEREGVTILKTSRFNGAVCTNMQGFVLRSHHQKWH